MNNAMHLSFQVKSSTINFNLVAPFCMWMPLKERINIYKKENFCLKCSKINANQNVSYNKPICNICNALDKAEYLDYHSKYLSN